MLCQNCQMRTANVHFTQIINNKKVEMYLCEKCANEKGHMGLGAPLSINDFISGMIGFSGNTPHVSTRQKNAVCDKCGMSYEDFQKTGKLGCSNCYTLFADRMEPLLKRLHGSTEYNGKLPTRLSKSLKATKEIETLKDLLNKAIQNEEYEKAAEIRDRIRSLEVGS